MTGPVVVPDGEPVGATRSGPPSTAGARVVLTTGGTGLTPTDLHPRGRPARCSTARCRASPRRSGRTASRKGVPTAALSRGLAGVRGSALVVNLPGSRGGVKDGLAVLAPLLVHAVEQIAGSDH